MLMKHFFICLLFVYLSFSQKFPWIKPADINQGLPASIQLFKLNTTNSLFGTNLTGAYARFDFNDFNLQFVVSHTEDQKSRTPMQWAGLQKNKVYAVLNGGYFDMVKNISASFICSQSKVYHANTINKEPNNKIFPTIGSFGILKNRTFSIQYTYSFGQQLSTYFFTAPNPYPGPQQFKDKGRYWQIQQGIGAGPIIIKNNQLVQGNPEHFNMDSLINFRHPRSAICYDQFNRLIFLAIDGRYSGSSGVTINQLGIIMQDLKCRDALNLDGGGSTLLYANDQILNKYSDPTPRPVVSAILIRDKYKPKIPNLISQ